MLKQDAVCVEGVTVSEAMVLADDGAPRLLQTICEAPSQGAISVSISSAADEGEEEGELDDARHRDASCSGPKRRHAVADLRALRAGVPADDRTERVLLRLHSPRSRFRYQVSAPCASCTRVIRQALGLDRARLEPVGRTRGLRDSSGAARWLLAGAWRPRCRRTMAESLVSADRYRALHVVPPGRRCDAGAT